MFIEVYKFFKYDVYGALKQFWWVFSMIVFYDLRQV